MALTVLGKALESAPSCGQHFELVEEAFGGFEVDQAGDALGDVVELFDAEGQGHAPLAAELVDEDLMAGMAFYVFEEQGRAAGREFPAGVARGRFGDAVGDLGDFQLRRDFFADAFSSPCFSRVLIQSRRSS